MSKRPDTPLDNSEKKKRKHLSLSIEQKVNLLRKLDCGVSVRRLREEFNVGTTTIYDLKKQKDELLKFYAESDEHKLMKNRKTLHKAKNEDLDCALKEWIRQRRSEQMPLTGQLIMEQAKIYHRELKIEGNCEYSTGWLQKFKKRHGIRFLKICGDEASAKRFIDEFAKIIVDENLTAEQVYNADETTLFWRYCPRKALTGINDAKDRLTVLGCTNAAGTHMCKLAVIGKSLRPRCFQRVNFLPVHYYADKNASITRDIFSDWFHSHFVPAARAHCREAKLDDDCKILLFLDDCSSHPPAELLIQEDNVYVMYFPPNVASLIQPCDQGILRSMKCKYKNTFLNSMLAAVNRGVSVESFQKEFKVKDAVYAVANAWNSVTKNTVMNAWHNLCPVTVLSDEDETDDFEKKMISDLVTYTKTLPSESVSKLEKVDIEEVLNIDNEAPVSHSMTDVEIAEMVLYSESDDEDIINTAVDTSTDGLVKKCNELIEGLEQRAFITEEEVMSVYKIKERLLQQKPLMWQ